MASDEKRTLPRDNMVSIGILALTKVYETKAIHETVFHDFSLDIEQGEKVSVLGASGCGKTTLLNIVAGIDREHEHDTVTVKAERIGYMFQTDRLLPWRTARANALLALEMQGRKDDPQSLEKLAEYFEKLGLAGAEGKYPGTLSGGMRQRVALIRLFLWDPDILLLDEPFAGLDFAAKLSMEDELLRFVLEGGRTMVFVTHDINEAIAVGTRLVVLRGAPTKGTPTEVVLDTEVSFESDVAGRSPTIVRQDPIFTHHYTRVWNVLKGE